MKGETPINKILYYSIKVLLPIIFAYAYMKYNQAKKLDNTLKLKLKGRSMIEFYLMIILSVAFVVYPAKEDFIGQAVFIGAFIFLFTYLMLERVVIVGRKLIFTKMFAFETRLVSKPLYKRGLFDFYIKNARVKVFLPVADVDHVLQMLSGSNRRMKRRVR